MATVDLVSASPQALADHGITRLPARHDSTFSSMPLVVIPLVITVVAIVAISLNAGAALLPTLGLIAAGLLLPLPLTWATARWMLVLGFVVLIIAGIAGAGAVPDTTYPELTWVAAVSNGMILVLGRKARDADLRRLAAADGAPPGPRAHNGRDVGLRAVWNVDEDDFEAQDPHPSVVLAAIDALDGRGRTTVTIFHAAGRLDVSGDAADRLLVSAFRKPDRDERDFFYAVDRPPQAGDTEGPTHDLLLARGVKRLPVPRAVTADLAIARLAAEHWLATGERLPSLTWWRDERATVPVGPLTAVG